jgi:predicted nucleic acid-binding protein
MIVLDTNVISELMRPQPAPQVVRWMAGTPIAGVFTTSVAQAEILYGISLLPRGKRRTFLEKAMAEIFEQDLAGRILPFDEVAAQAFAVIAADRRAAGRPIGPFDAQIAAIARAHDATVATRDVADFAGCGIAVTSPWHVN